MRCKYGFKKHLTDCENKVGVSHTWLHMLKVKNCTEENLRWIIGKGNVDFWKDKWWGEDKLEMGSGIDSQPLTVETALDNGLTNLGLHYNQIQKMQGMINLLNNEDNKGILYASINGK